MKRLFFVIGVLLMAHSVILAQLEKDYTQYVLGADCDDGRYWYIANDADISPALLQCDTWSSRGDKDGSNMIAPFMEYWENRDNHTLDDGSHLPDAQIRHEIIQGLPKGKYRLSMKVRCYAETYSGYANPAGVRLYANGVESEDCCSGKSVTPYSGGAHITSTPELAFEVGEDGILDFGLNVSGAYHTELSWVAWKDVRLTYMSKTMSNGEYYLRNKATGRYLEAGGKYGTQGVFGLHGELFSVQWVNDNEFFLSTKLLNNDNGGHYMSVDGYNNYVYLDAAQQKWTIEPGQEGYFTIRSDRGYFGSNGDMVVATDLSNSTSNNVQWEFIPRTTRIKRLLDGTDKDATFLIADPRFDRHHTDASEWVGSGFSLGGANESGASQCAEVWNSNFDISQILTNIPNGRYQFKAQGYFRYNDTWDNTNSRALETHYDGTEQLYAEFYAQSGNNTANVAIQSITDEIDNLASFNIRASNSGMPYTMTEAGYAFAAGLYHNNTFTIDVTNHTLSIGIRKEQQDGTDWTIWDNFELTLLSIGDNTGYKYDEEETGESIDFSKATPDNPVDCTSLIKSADFSNTTGWSGNLSRSNTANRFATYGGTGVVKVTFDVYQTIDNLPNGWYRLKVQGLYRYGDVKTEEHNSYGGNNENQYNDVWATYTIPYATITRQHGIERQLATLYANGVSVGLPSIFEGAHDVETHNGDYHTPFGWVPDTSKGVEEAFDAGEYWTELIVPVFDQSITLGVSKSLGYKYDWTCFDNFRLEYLGDRDLIPVTDIKVEDNQLNLTLYEQRIINASVLPANASDDRLTVYSTNENVVTYDPQTGMVTAAAAGNAEIRIFASGAVGGFTKSIPVTVTGNADGNIADLVINEIQVSNLDMFLDPSKNYGGFIELYNPTSKAILLKRPYVSDDPDNPQKSYLDVYFYVPAKGFTTIWFDHNNGESGNYVGNANFKLNMDGGTIFLYDRYGNFLTSQTYPAATSRTSYARTTDGGNQWGVTAYPTPGASNKNSSEIITGTLQRVKPPQALPGTGFYTMKNFLPTISGDGTIYCTLDGSVPSETNGVTPDQLTAFNGTTVLRMRAFEKGKLPSEVITCTYAQSQYSHSLPVLMVTADPDALYSDELGIFVTGTNGKSGAGIEYPCNWNRDWDRSANMQLLDKDGTPLFQQDVNIARFGGWSRSWVPYNFKLKAQKQYEGNNYLEYPFFTDNKPYLKHKALQVRNGGNDVSCRIKDAALHNIIISSGFYLDCLDYQPVHCYINGQYYGMQNLREPSNKHYGVADYGIDNDEIDAMEFGGGSSPSVKAGNSDAYWEWYNLSSYAYDDDTYQQICDLVDVNEFANYMAAELYLGGDDWPGNNCKGFKGKDGKFHIVFFDVDQALRFDIGSFNRITNNGAAITVLFRNMLNNETFRKLFIDSYCIFGGSVMEPERCHAIIDRISDEMNPALSLEGLSTSPTADYMKRVLSTTRQETMITALTNWNNVHLNGTRAYQVKFSSNIEAAQLQVNGIDVPTRKFNGTLFAPAVLKASAPEGYVFKGWQTQKGEWLSKNETFDLAALSNSEALSNVLEFTAVYEEMDNDAERINDIALPIKVNEVSAGNTVFASETWKRSDWIELYNTTDMPIDVAGLFVSDDIDQPLKYQISKPSELSNTVIPAGGHLIVWADALTSNTGKQLHANFKLANTDGEQVIVVSGDDFVANNPIYFNAHPDMKSFIDGITYKAHRGDESVGRYPDGGKAFYKMTRPTIERTNRILKGDDIIGYDESLTAALPDRFNLQLAKGWNWISHCLYTPFSPNELPLGAQRVVAQIKEAYRLNGKMVGNLSLMEAGNLYKVEMKETATFTSDKLFCDSNMPIGLLPGWNWIGYTADGAQTLTAALGNYMADEGDKLLGQSGFATFTSGAWNGTLSTLETGKGYMLYTQRAKILSFNSPHVRVNARKAPTPKMFASNRFGVDKYAYPNLMGLVGILLQDDETLANPDRYTILAYADGECRGVGVWMDSLIYLTSYGHGGETLQFIAYDEMDGTAYPVTEVLNFQTDVKGSSLHPMAFHIGTGETTDITHAITNNAPHITVDGYYNLNGTLVGHHGTSLAPGIYIVRYKDGSFRKIYIH